MIFRTIRQELQGVHRANLTNGSLIDASLRGHSRVLLRKITSEGITSYTLLRVCSRVKKPSPSLPSPPLHVFPNWKDYYQAKKTPFSLPSPPLPLLSGSLEHNIKELTVIFVLVVCPIMPVQAKFQICTIFVPDILETCQFYQKS
ncbi:hypothetical protein Hanom_Chr00s131892g01815651 [Helianthus anomalus]